MLRLMENDTLYETKRYNDTWAASTSTIYADRVVALTSKETKPAFWGIDAYVVLPQWAQTS